MEREERQPTFKKAERNERRVRYIDRQDHGSGTEDLSVGILKEFFRVRNEQGHFREIWKL